MSTETYNYLSCWVTIINKYLGECVMYLTVHQTLDLWLETWIVIN